MRSHTKVRELERSCLKMSAAVKKRKVVAEWKTSLYQAQLQHAMRQEMISIFRSTISNGIKHAVRFGSYTGQARLQVFPTVKFLENLYFVLVEFNINKMNDVLLIVHKQITWPLENLAHLMKRLDNPALKCMLGNLFPRALCGHLVVRSCISSF